MRADIRFMKKLKSFQPLKLAVHVGLVCGIAFTGISETFAGPAERAQAKRMHDRLAGIPPTEAMLCAMDVLMSAPISDPEQAAHLVMSLNPAADTKIPNFSDATNACGNVDNGLSKKAFYSVSLKNMVTPWTNEEMTPLADLNDYSALVIGMVRDDVAFDTVLSTNLYYQANPAGVTISATANPNDNQVDPHSESDNGHYADLQNQGYDLSLPSVLTSNIARSDFPGLAEKAGVVTTRAASLAFFTGGTNRLMWRATSMNYLCRDLEQMKDVSGTPDRVRQDVSRSPGGDSSIFLSACVGCHAGMDPLSGAYAYYDHELTADTDGNRPTGRMLWQENSTMFDDVISGGAGVGETLFNDNCAGCHATNDPRVVGASANAIANAINTGLGGMNTPQLLALVGPQGEVTTEITDIEAFLAGNDPAPAITVTQKHLINAGNFRYGFVTETDQWINYWRVGPNAELEWGWNQGNGAPATNVPIATGNGAASLGYEVTSTKAFAQCQVEKAYKHVCLHDPITDHTADIQTITDEFRTEGYLMKNVFAKVAPLCMDDPQL